MIGENRNPLTPEADGFAVQEPVRVWRRRPSPPLDPLFLGLILVMLAGYLLTATLFALAHAEHGRGLMPLAPLIYHTGGLNGDVWEGEIWRPVTYMFLHSDFWHLFWNIVTYGLGGFLVFRAFAGRGWLAIFLVTGVLSGMAQILWRPDSLVVGASGGIMGLWGAALAAGCRYQNTPVAERVRWYRVNLLLVALALYWMLVPSLGAKGIAHVAHFTGLVGGFVMGLVLSRRVEAKLIELWPGDQKR